MNTDTRHRIYYGFLAALWLPLLAVLLSSQIGSFVGATLRDPSSYDEELNRLRQKTPLWNGAIALYNRALYAIGVSGRPGAAQIGSSGWVFLGDLFSRNFAQALGRRVLDEREVERWTTTLGLQGKWLSGRSIPYAFVVAPAKWSIYPDRMPRWTHDLKPVHSFDRVLAAGKALPLIDLRAALREARNHVDTYSALNSHWTDYGALIAWEQIAGELPRYLPDLATPVMPTLKKVAIIDKDNEFAGMLNLAVPNDWTTYELREPLPDLVIVNKDGSEMALAGGSKTDLLDLPRVTRNDHAGNRLRALILRDSSGNSLSPFLQNAFYLAYQVDHRLNSPGTWPNLIGLVEEFRPDFVLWVMTERYFNDPVGDLDYWRDVDAYECSGGQGKTWPSSEAAIPFAVTGDATLGLPLRLTMRADSDARIIRLSLLASASGELLAEGSGIATSPPRKLHYQPGRNELFLRIAGDPSDTALSLRAADIGTARIDKLEIRSIGANCSAASTL